MRHGPREEALQERLAEHVGDLTAEPTVRAAHLRPFDALEHRRGHPFHEHAAEELQPGRVARLAADDLDRHPERANELGEPLGTVTRRERRRPDAVRGHRPEERHVREPAPVGSTTAATPRLSAGAVVLRSA